MKEKSLIKKMRELIDCVDTKGVFYQRPKHETEIEEDVAEAVKKLKEEDKDLEKQLLRDFKTKLTIKSMKRFIKARFKMSNEKKDKIMGNFNNSPRKSMVDTEQRSKLSQPGSNPGEDTHIKKDKGCGKPIPECYCDCGDTDINTGITQLHPKCEVGLKEDKQ